MLSKPKVDFVTHEQLDEILSARFSQELRKLSDIPSPSLLKDSQKAVERIARAIKSGEKIVLIGDYDVDGVTSSAITKSFFNEINAPLEVIIPNRFSDGYGVSAKILERVKADLIITVDNGITAVEAAQICKDRGVDLIITDHHTPPEILPEAYAIVNPKLHDCPYPFKEICGAQVAWLLMAQLKKELNINVNMSAYLELLALAIVADVMPLIGINRALVKKGLEMISASKTPAFIIIREFLEKKVLSSEDIGFQIAPRLNSAGRLEDASIALNFLLSKSEKEAYEYFEILDSLNRQRKAIESDVTQEASLKVDKSSKVIVAFGDEWNEGVVGIVASRLVGSFGVPAIVLSVKNGIAKGSARSIGDVDIYELISTQMNLLEKFGGHKMAAGLSLKVENLEQFINNITKEALKIDKDKFIPKDSVLAKLKGSDINFDLINLMQKYEPYGEANPRPKFLLEDATVEKISLFGNSEHSKIDLHVDGYQHQLVLFREALSLETKSMSCSYGVGKNVWNGKVSLQLIIERVYE
ncbi:MAG: single-stranded-DNA-specific exonuclease RecJ [Campylobacterota bacterium]|nr:single-stranded-DNA-specific exonuclease RecJ [Campylobacterota bacterium]